MLSIFILDKPYLRLYILWRYVYIIWTPISHFRECIYDGTESQ